MKKREGKQQSRAGAYFLVSVVALYLLLFPFRPEAVQEGLRTSGGLLLSVVPIILLVALFMGVINYFASPRSISRYVGKGSGVKGWALAVSIGIVSHGPVYLWYPLLRDLRTRGMRSGLAAAFLYNRAIKIPLLPLMVYYFGPLFVAVLLFLMIVASVIEGTIVERIDG